MDTQFTSITRSETNSNRLTFQLKPSHVAYANTLRRLCMAHVKTVGFRADLDDKGSMTDVKVLANSTPMTNEMLAHRIGLLPVYANPEEWESNEQYSKYTFRLEVENKSQSMRDVTTRDFIVVDSEGKEVKHDFFRNSNSAIHDGCLIATLKPLVPGNEPEKIHIVAVASVGIGRENARFIPTCQATYAYTQSTDEAKIDEAFEKWLSDDKKVQKATLEQQDAEKLKAFRREFNTLQIQRVYEKDEVTGEANSFDFVIESVGPIKPEVIVQEASKAGRALCEKYSKENLPESVTVEFNSGSLAAYDFIFQGEDHTLGHLVQAWLDQNKVRDEGPIVFVGYDIPHPLRDEMVIRIGINDGKQETARTALREAMVACGSMFTELGTRWVQALGGPKPAVATAKATGAPKRVLKRPGTSTGANPT